MAYVLTVTFKDDDSGDYVAMAKDVLDDEYSNGGFDGFKPTLKITEDDQ